MSYTCKMIKGKTVECPCVRHCPLFGDCLIEFLKQTEKEEQPAPCPWCGQGVLEVEWANATECFVLCLDGLCGAQGPKRETHTEAVEAWNEVAKKPVDKP